MTSEVLYKFIPDLPASVLFHKNCYFTLSKLFISVWVCDVWKGFHVSYPTNYLYASGCWGSRRELGITSMELFLLHLCIMPVFHQSNKHEWKVSCVFTKGYLEAEFINVRNMERMQRKPNSVVSPTSGCRIGWTMPCNLKSWLLETDSGISNLFSTLVSVGDLVVGFLEPGWRCELNCISACLPS